MMRGKKRRGGGESGVGKIAEWSGSDGGINSPDGMIYDKEDIGCPIHHLPILE
jgi:hypothetical protein